MGRLIDESKIKFNGDSFNDNEEIYLSLADIRMAIAQTPTEDAEIIIHAKWNNDICTNCEKINPTTRLNEYTLKYESIYLPRCPFCGAKMNGDLSNKNK